VHVQPTPSARAHVHAGPDWGRSGLRHVHHVYHCGLALETRTERSATDQAIAYYYGMREVMDELRLTDGPSRQILAWASTRLVRLVRRGGVAPTQVAMFAAIRVLEAGELGPVDGVLTDLVQVQAYADGGLHDEGVETAKRLLALWHSHEAAVPWAAALYLDALSEFAPVWFWAYHQHVVHEEDHLVLALLEHALQITATTERPTDPTLEDVTRYFRMQPLDRVRTPYPLAMGAALVALGRRREALVFHDAAVRVAEWVCDIQGLLVALEARARTNEELGEHDQAADDWQRLVRLHAKPEWETARDQARVRASAVPRARGRTGGKTKKKRERRR
jgi:tetratricopeptide (TPR) repeat protein